MNLISNRHSAAPTVSGYETEDGSRKSEYGKYITQDGKEVRHQHIIWYNDGITSEHVIAHINNAMIQS